MKILEHIAQDIVEKTSEILQYPISITDDKGYIIGATDKSRIGIFHEPSLEVIKKNIMIDCKSEIEKRILPGVSVPIKFNSKVIGVLGVVGEPREVEKYGQLVKNQVEMLCQEAFRKEMVELKEKMIEVFVHQIIHYKENEENDHILNYANLLDIEMDKDQVCLLIDIHSLSEKISAGNFPLAYFQREVLDFLNLLFQENKGDIVSFLNIERFIIIKSLPFYDSYSSFMKRLDEKLGKLNSFLESKYQVSACMAVGDISHGIKEVSESYNNAKKAMSIGISSSQTSNIYIYNEREIMLHLLPKDLSATYRKKLMKIIAPLVEHDSYDVLSSTFIAYCKNNMKLSEASRSLYIHRNTTIYRLERISEITSLNTSNFEHCMLLYTAIQCYEEK
ncbi:transcriptional regulator [Cytobacillus depressus]|uniref:Transcriptional regulator n=1 Tax=Cytobacillus depressus TaxID=1602942 RepID=A0A6L3V2X6_9BACI|nr:sugar diacid recognition domain-containing protein [Cytobacillus depressus]KAB2333290.1 transcriptional regulator [Cytobacillus depressus]